MIRRPFWIQYIESAWQRRTIVWLAGVRRVGKTTLAKMFPDALYMNCDLPSTASRLTDPELFYRSLHDGTTIIFDEIHRLPDPSLVLKIAADEFPQLRVLATGSSTLSATKKFRDTLTGRKIIISLPPILWTECRNEFGVRDLDKRLLHGGLPEMLLADTIDETWYSEWLDSFYARDMQELFGIRERTGFLNLLRLMLRQSGGLVDYSSLARECDVSRPTVKAHLEAMAIACALVPLPPFHKGNRREMLRRPKVYAFDTGFVAFARGWRDIRDDDRGILWEHLVLDVLRTAAGIENVRFWRDKTGREIDFVIPRGEEVDAIECKINPDRFDAASLRAFRETHPLGRNFVVSPGVETSYARSYENMPVNIIGCRDILDVYGKSQVN